ncbi:MULTISPECIES: hypothetical protein [Streptomyces]|uniref:DUF4232 domain-containing protein n=1 Tax=Streptomyces dengpaensis TaxID=2049881 RepID=A0ABM6SRR8_9ACTN|nr:hypothetical protein [Streptomyces sp. HG99]AVH57428.1 hypothetical protein C4B68_18455 [Streptomyces dengpaensis]
MSHGPNGQPDGQGPEGPDGLDVLGSDELALRRLLHQAVQEIEPADGTLDHLRRAVPARRARKRQAMVGMAAAALFIGTAVPALVHVSNSTGSNPDPSIAGSSSHAQGGQGEGKSPDGGDGKAAGGSSGASNGKGKDDQKDTPDQGKGNDKGSGAATGGGTDPTPSAETATACTAAQLGGATSAIADPDSTGAVYGSFTVSNVSTVTCTVTSAGTVGATAQGAADPAKIGVATHVPGDAATGLPDPSTEVTSMVLQPGASYVVKFAWVPSETCPTVSEPSPDPSPTEGTGDGTTSEPEGTTPQLATEEGVADGSVVVSNTAETGSATATATVSNACAGTVYHTGILAAS